MPRCCDYGGVKADGSPCKRQVAGRSPCSAHRKVDPIALVPKSDDDPYPVGHLSVPARRAWATYTEVVPEHEWPELYGAILALNGWIESGARAAALTKDDGSKPELQMQRCESTWKSAKKSLRLEERLGSAEKRSGLDRLRAV